MIQKTKIWLRIISKGYDLEPVEGKWLCFGNKEDLHKHVEELNKLVEGGIIRAAKISRKIPEYDLFPIKPCVLCVYTSDDPQEKNFVYNFLREKMNLNPLSWKSNAETDMDWREEGKLRREYLENIILKGCKKYPKHMEMLNKALDEEGNERA